MHVDLLLLFRGDRGPSGLRPVAVVIPLEEGDLVVGEELVEEVEDVFANVGAREVEEQLVAALGARDAR